MALNNDITPEVARDRLTAWLAAQPGVSAAAISDVSIPSANGLSNETLLFDAAWTQDGVARQERLVARVEPAGAGLAPAYDIVKEARLLQQLAGAGLAVPRVRFVEPDASWLGARFLVMEFLAGRVAADSPSYFVGGWVFDLTPAEKAQVAENAIAQLARVSRVDWEAADLGFLAREEPGATALDREIAYFERWMAWAREDDHNPVVDAAFAWVKANRPAAEEPLALSWGDSRLGNVLYADDRSVAGLLDWEFATIASPELDLGWWIFIQRHFLDPHGIALPEGWPDRAEAIAIWERHAGRTAANIDFHEVFAGLRFCVMMVRAAALVKAAGIVPPDSPMAHNNPGTQVLAQLIGVDAPAGAGAHVIGNAAD
jgi:aminoglycoside phosphotransferase (APT) family kinase protein